MRHSAREALSILLISNHRRFKINFRAYPWARELARRGHRVDVFCHADTERWRTRIERVDGFRIVENPDLLVGALRQGWDPYCAWRRRHFLFRQNQRYDIIHCLDTRLAVVWPALALAKATATPIVSDWIDWWGRGGLIKERRPGWYRVLFGGVETWFEEHYRPRLDGLTAISHALVDRAIKLGCDPARCKVIHGGADLDTFGDIPPQAQAKEALGIPSEAPVVCFSGLDVLIDLPLAVAAFERVLEEEPQARLLLVGPGNEQVQSMIQRANVRANVIATGPVPYKELPGLLAAADVFLMPYTNKISNIGRWPNKVGDYMAVGRPVVSNPVGEVKWLMDSYDIGLVADETPESMAAAVLTLLRDPEGAQAMGKRARQCAETVFSWEHLIVDLESWYYDILAQLGRLPQPGMGASASSSLGRAR